VVGVRGRQRSESIAVGMAGPRRREGVESLEAIKALDLSETRKDDAKGY
jgi:hypothetical protein